MDSPAQVDACESCGAPSTALIHAPETRAGHAFNRPVVAVAPAVDDPIAAARARRARALVASRSGRQEDLVELRLATRAILDLGVDPAGAAE